MRRRDFLGGATAAALATGLPRLSLAQVAGSLAANSTERGIDAADLAQARLAQRVFREARARGRLPVDLYLDNLAQDLRLDLEHLATPLNDVALVYLGKQIKAIAETDLRSRVQRRSSQAGDNFRPGLAACVVPAFGAARLYMQGYCMDSRLPAPGSEDEVRLVESSRYYDPEIRPVIGDVLRYAARHNTDRTVVQHILWGLRELNEDSDYAHSLVRRPDLLRIIAEASPEAGAGLLKRLEEAQRKRARDEAITRFLNMVLGPGGIHTALPALRELLDPQSARSGIERHLSSLNRPVTGDYHIYPEAPYAQLANGVYAETKGSGPLAVSGAIINLTPDDFTFEPAAWVGEPMKPQQRVAFDRVDSRVVPIAPDPDGFSAQEFAKDVGEMLGQKLLGINLYQTRWGLVENIINKHRIGLESRYLDPPKENRNFFEKALDAGRKSWTEALRFAPIIGNAWSLYEAFSPNSSPAERVISLLGAIPGYGALATAAGSATRLAKVADGALNAAPRLAQFVDKTALLRDIAEIGTIQISNDERELWQHTYALATQLVEQFAA